MNDKIHNLFEQYRKNYTGWNALEMHLMRLNSKEEWLKDFYKTMASFQSIYDSNKEIISEVSCELEKNDAGIMDSVYDEIFFMYMQDYNDAEFIIDVCKKLLTYYEEKQDYSRLVQLYTIIQNYEFEVANPEGSGADYDFSNLLKGMGYLKHYGELDEEARYRIWILYYSYIVRLGDYGIISIDEVLDRYDEIMNFSKQPEFISLDAGNDRIERIKAYIEQTLFICIGMIDRVDEVTRQRFYQYTKEFFVRSNDTMRSPYELPSELYAGYLYTDFMEGKLSINEVFLKYLEYFTYKFQFIKAQTKLDQDEIIQCINAIRFLAGLGRYVSDRELVSKARNQLADFVQAKWIKNNLSSYERISMMLGQVCLSFLTDDMITIDKEKSITQLIVQRDIDVYIHSKITAEIAMAIYREVTESNTDFFSTVKSVPSNEWINFLFYASLFHDIGRTKVMGTVVVRSRPSFAGEEERQRKHTLYGAKVIGSIEGVAKYADIIKGHHTWFNGENAGEYLFERADSDLNPFIDIIAVASFIEEATNRFFDFSHQAKRFQSVLQDMKAQSGTRFNNRLVELISDSEALQKKIEKLVTTDREEIIYDVYHNWEKIQLSQDENSMLGECLEGFEEFRRTRDERAFETYRLKLEHLAKKAKQDNVRATALYKLMMFRLMRGQYADGLALSAETERLLKKTKNFELLSQFYYILGNTELLLDNTEPSFSAFLTGVFVAEKTPGCENIKNTCLLSIASIFLMKYNFKKAKEYFDLCDIDILSPDEQVRYLCMKGYAHARLHEIEAVEEIAKQVENLMIEHEELVLYPQYVYMAMFAASLGKNDRFEEYLAQIKSIKLEADDATYYSDEMIMHIELLDRAGRAEEASEALDRYMALCNGKSEYSNLLVKLLNLKIKVLADIQNLSEVSRYESALQDVFYVSFAEEARKIEDLEKKLLQEIKLKEEHDKVLSNKEILEESVRKAKNDSEQKSQFLSSMSHEIRTPINAILGLNEMIMRESTEEPVLQYAFDIQNAGKQLLGIINDVLDYSKIEAGKMEIVPQRYDVSGLIKDIKNMLEPKLKEKCLDFRIRYNEDMPAVLYGDDLRIKQILLNLLSNAYKYTKEGFVEFSVDYVKNNEQSVKVSFSVKDSGIGLKKEQIEKIANPFERFDLEKNRGIEGTGLGMGIVNRLLEQMNSKLVIESEYGKGSIFSFEIEQGVIEWNSAGGYEKARKAYIREENTGKSTLNGSVHAPDAKILIVDDNAVNLKVAAALLKRTGIQVTCASSGRECLELCKETSYHIIMLDHMMPEMDGIETLKHIKEDSGVNSKTPTVALTANVVDSADNFYIKSGFDALLSKPIDAVKMEELISNLLPDYLLE